MSLNSDLIAKLETSLYRGLITEDEFVQECYTVITADANRRKRERSPYVAIENSSFCRVTHYYLTESEREAARDTWLSDKMELDMVNGYGEDTRVTMASKWSDPGSVCVWIEETRKV